MNKEDIGLDCNDDFHTFENISRHKIARKKKTTIKLFKKSGLSINCN